MVSVFIHGSCVSRGVFDYAKAGGSEKNFKVIEYIAKNSIFSLWGNPTPLKFEDLNADLKKVDWNTRMVYYDANKLVTDRIQNYKADIFVMDFVDERLRRIHRNDTSKSVLTYSESFLRGKYLEQLKEYEWVDFDSASYYEAYDIIIRYCEFIKNYYRQEQIFIIEAFPVLTYYDKNREMNLFNQGNIQSALRLTKQLEMYYEIVQRCLPDANYIKFPRNVCGLEEHKFGLSNVHYEYDYYDYVLGEIIRNIPTKALK